MNIDQAVLKLGDGGIVILNIILGIIMFGVAIDIKLGDFAGVLKRGRGPIIGLAAQFFALPAFTYLLTMVIQPTPSIALGMILVAACPGGNASNFITHLSKSNTALSISMTAISTAAAIFMTPFNVAFWGGLNPHTAPLLKQVNVGGLEMLGMVVMILGVPLVLGMLVSHNLPKLATQLRKPFKIGSVVVFTSFIVIAFAQNVDNFLKYIHLVFFAVLIHNALALSSGYWISRLFRLRKRDARAVAIEVGIQNSALGLALVFNFFGGMGGMAITAAWWGIWHLVAGLSLAFYWSRKPDMLETTA